MKAVSFGPLIVKVAVPVELLEVPVMVEVVSAGTATVVIWNVPVVAPVVIVSVPGTVADAELELSVTT